MAGVRPHHVLVLERRVSGDTWLVYDANSGHGATQVHERNLRGYTIVDPGGGGGIVTVSAAPAPDFFGLFRSDPRTVISGVRHRGRHHGRRLG